MIVIACNTASACSLDQVKNSFDIPIVEVVGPGAATAVRETVNKKVGVIGTVATVSSGVYEKAILKLDPEIESIRRLVLCLCHWLRKAGGKMTLR